MSTTAHSPHELALSLPECHSRLVEDLSGAAARLGKQLPALITLKRMSAKGKLDQCMDPARRVANQRPRYFYSRVRALLIADWGVDASEPIDTKVEPTVLDVASHETSRAPGTERDMTAGGSRGASAAPVSEPVSLAALSSMNPPHQDCAASASDAAGLALLGQLEARQQAMERCLGIVGNTLAQMNDAIERLALAVEKMVQAKADPSDGGQQDVAAMLAAIQSLDELRKSLMVRFDAENSALRQRLEQTTEALNQARAAASGLDTVRLLSLLGRLEHLVTSSASAR